MNSIENAIRDVISEQMESGLVERLVAEQLEKGINKALGDIFGSWGSGTKAITSKIESVMIPFLEGYDYSKYVLKLDSVLCEILQNCTAGNRAILENFKSLTMVDDRKEITVSDLFKMWCKHVGEKVSTDGLEVTFDDSPSYEGVEVSCEFREDEKSAWSSLEGGRLIFECEHDQDMNYEMRLSRWDREKSGSWSFNTNALYDISSLRHISEFEVAIMRLKQSGVKVIIDETCISDFITPDKEPEATFC